MTTVNTSMALSKEEKMLLIDGYCRKYRYHQNYISIDLCHIIRDFITNIFNLSFIIIFEKYKDNDDYVNELLCYDVKLKTTIIKNNQLWKYNLFTSYYVDETKNDCLIYRVGGSNNDRIQNVEYSMMHDTY